MRSSHVNSMEVVVNKDAALEKLRENRKTHSKIVEEAREGYMKEAIQALNEKLDDLRSGNIVQLNFSLYPPQDFTKVYDIAIKMLEMHTEDTIVLDGAQVQHMIMDDWEWMDSFLLSNMKYSSTAVEVGTTKGL